MNVREIARRNWRCTLHQGAAASPRSTLWLFGGGGGGGEKIQMMRKSSSGKRKVDGDDKHEQQDGQLQR